MTNYKKSKKISNKLLSKVIDRIQDQLLDLGNVTYNIRRLPLSTQETDKLYDKIYSFLFAKPYTEVLDIILYSRSDMNKAVNISISIDAILRATSKDGNFADKELIEPTVYNLRYTFESLQ